MKNKIKFFFNIFNTNQEHWKYAWILTNNTEIRTSKTITIGVNSDRGKIFVK